MKKYRDPKTGLTAMAMSRLGCWGLIRNECHRLKLQVPKIDELIEL